MFTIQSSLAVDGTHWGLEFKAGVAHTDNAALAEKLKDKGYVVTGEAIQTPEVEPEVEPAKKAPPKKTK